MRVAPPTRDVLPVRTDTPCRAHRFPPLRANILAPPSAPARPRFRHSCAHVRTPSVTRSLLRRLLRAWAPPSRSLAALCDTDDQRAPLVRERTGLGDGARTLPCELLTGLRFDVLERARGGGSRGAAASGRPASGGRCGRTGCGCWWPREARTSCRGCSTGWSGAVSRWISGRSARAGASRRRCRRHARSTRGSAVDGPQGAAVWLRPPEPGLRGGACAADTVGARRGRWGRPRSRTTRGHGGDGVPPGPPAAHAHACRVGLSRWPSRKPRGWSPEHGRGH